MEPLGQDEIRASFVNCTRGEAKGLTLPARPDEIPWEKREFLGWRDPKAAARAYLVLPYQGETVGLSLRAAPRPKGRVLLSNMCGLCTTTHPLSDIALFSGRRAGKPGREGNTLGIYACANLACSQYIRGELKSDVPQPSETLTLEGTRAPAGGEAAPVRGAGTGIPLTAVARAPRTGTAGSAPSS